MRWLAACDRHRSVVRFGQGPRLRDLRGRRSGMLSSPVEPLHRGPAADRRRNSVGVRCRGAPAIYDLLAGGLGALIGGVLLRSIGPLSFRAPLVTLVTGVGAALLASWLTRIATWAPEPPLRRPDDASPFVGTEHQQHDVMTTGEATAMLRTHPQRRHELLTAEARPRQ